MCAEKDPITCHRAILVCRHLRTGGISIQHILEDGAIESQSQLEERLLKLTGVEGESLFMSREQAIELAYEKQGDRIAFTRSKGEPLSEETRFEHEDIYNRVH